MIRSLRVISNGRFGVQCQVFQLVSGLVIFPAESHLAILKTDQAIVGDGDAVGISTRVVQHLGRVAEGWLGIDYPFDAAASFDPMGKDIKGPLCQSNPEHEEHDQTHTIKAIFPWPKV